MDCARHPQVNAPYVCSVCAAPICQTCVFSSADGTRYCQTCASTPNPAPRSANVTPAKPATFIAVAAPTNYCVQHRSVPAVRTCDACHAWMCATCDFALPGEMHVCPPCAAAPRDQLSDRRKTLLWISYVAAVWCTIGMVLLVTGVVGHHHGGDDAENTAVGLLILGPAVAGVAISVSAMERHLPNPLNLRISIVWNGLLLGIYFLLILVGTCR